MMIIIIIKQEQKGGTAPKFTLSKYAIEREINNSKCIYFSNSNFLEKIIYN